jgi:SAM-dependent methyltransferase
VGEGLSSVARCVNIDLFPHAKNEVTTIQADLTDAIPLGGEVADLSLSLYVIRYLNDPVAHINELIRVTKSGGFVIVNGISAIRFERHGEEYRYFTDWNDKTDSARATLYANDDWLIIKVDDPTFQLEGFLIPEHSYTIVNNSVPKEIMDKAYFVYDM